MPLFKSTPAPQPIPKREPTLEEKLQAALARKSSAEDLVHTGAFELQNASDSLAAVSDLALDEVNRLNGISQQARANSASADGLASEVLSRLAPVAPQV